MLRDEFLISRKKPAHLSVILYPSESADVKLLENIFPSVSGNVYFVSGEANYRVYNPLEPYFRRAMEQGAKIYFLTGPIISVPNGSATGKTTEQASRIKMNAITKLALENNRFFLYPSEERQPYHYRVFKEINKTLAFEEHELKRGAQKLWIWENSYNEAEARIGDFYKRVRGARPIKESLTDFFVFLTEKEINELKEWSARKNKSTESITLENCKSFWTEAVE